MVMFQPPKAAVASDNMLPPVLNLLLAYAAQRFTPVLPGIAKLLADAPAEDLVRQLSLNSPLTSICSPFPWCIREDLRKDASTRRCKLTRCCRYGEGTQFLTPMRLRSLRC